MNFIFDIDGTISFGDNQIDSDIYKELKSLEENGHKLIFATARSYRDSLPVIREYFKDNVLVGLNGGYVYENSKIGYSKIINEESFARVMKLVLKKDLAYFIDEEFNYSCYKEEKFEFVDTIDPLKLADRLNLEVVKNPVKIVISLSDLSEKDKFVSSIKEIPLLDVLYHEREDNLYINSHGTTKASTILEVLNGQDYVAYGNDKNDIDMFKNALYCVQVGDLDYLKSYSNEVTSKENLVYSIRTMNQKFKATSI